MTCLAMPPLRFLDSRQIVGIRSVYARFTRKLRSRGRRGGLPPSRPIHTVLGFAASSKHTLWYATETELTACVVERPNFVATVRTYT